MARMGRPPIADPRHSNFTVRMTASEAMSLRKCAEALQLTKTEILMRGLRLAEAEVQKRQAAVEKHPA
ncbi:MAG: hypothetical protein IJ668_06310 [Selenomonadaceae bacterium]|nr:hypothetical protein [Selenomonadaceae bacterium]